MVTIEFKKPGAADEAIDAWAKQGIHAVRSQRPRRLGDGSFVEVHVGSDEVAAALGVARSVDPDATTAAD